jgi:hypothetical protein
VGRLIAFSHSLDLYIEPFGRASRADSQAEPVKLCQMIYFLEEVILV